MKLTKRLLSLAVIVAAGMMGGEYVNAQTAKSASASVPASALWNGDVPSAEVIYSFFYKGSSRYEHPLKSHGYVLTDNIEAKKAVKPGFCDMEFKFTDDGATLDIRLDDATGRQWLVDNIEWFIKNVLKEEATGYTVRLEDDVIHFDWVVDI